MPIYTFWCSECDVTVDTYRKLGDYHADPCPGCGLEMQKVISQPAVIVWNESRKFPNLSPHGDGSMTFKSKKSYESYLKKKGFAELGVSAPIKTPHGNRVLRKV